MPEVRNFAQETLRMIMRSSKKARPQLIISPPKETCVGYKMVSRLNCFDEKEGSVPELKVADDTEFREIISFGSILPDVPCVHAQ